ncbi:hypothetical protein M8818_004391 [Zalaria obscura]|uniref:Uncharacterized protein n=1 Tax=Zalaria obscura TaxID=2024903 RepID=A0ACC3SBF5_9PEZI
MFRSVPFRPTLRELLGKKEASSHKRCGKMLEFSALQLARRPVNLRYPLLHHLYVNSRLNRVGALLISTFGTIGIVPAQVDMINCTRDREYDFKRGGIDAYRKREANQTKPNVLVNGSLRARNTCPAPTPSMEAHCAKSKEFDATIAATHLAPPTSQDWSYRFLETGLRIHQNGQDTSYTFYDATMQGRDACRGEASAKQ